jgi:transposase
MNSKKIRVRSSCQYKSRQLGTHRVVDDGWRIPDALWERIEPMLPPPKPHPLGCHNPPVPPRQAMNAIFFVLRTGCQWSALDRTRLCKKSSAHRWFQTWARAGVFLLIWALGLEEYEELKGLDWKWQSMDGAMTKAPLGGEKNRAQPHRSGETRRQAEHVDRGRWNSHRSGRGGCQRQRLQVGA